MLSVDVIHTLGTFRLEATFTGGAGLTALFGPSGAGKTTVVNLIAGLIKPTQGRVAVDDVVLVDTARGIFIPKHKRRIGYIFQDARLFPHLTVRQNLLFGRWFAPRGERSDSLTNIVALLGLEHLLERAPRALSGGEKQRVAIGRALLASPRLLLMDEPLASLDDSRKEEILPFIERLRDEVRIPIVLVSHAVAEVARLATTVVLMADGRVIASGPIGEMLNRFDATPVTDRLEAGAVLETQVQSHDTRFALTHLKCAAGIITVPHIDLAPGTAVRLRIRARDVMIATEKPRGLSALNILPGRIAELGPEEGSMRQVRLDLKGDFILAGVTARSISELNLVRGREIYAVIKTVAIVDAARSAAFPAETHS